MKKLKWHLLGKVVFPKVFQIFGKQLATPIWITTCQYGFFNRNEKTQFFYQNSQRRVWKGLKNKKWKSLKFIYSEKPTKFCEISTLNLTTVHTVKSKVEISQIFVAFSKYMNFKITWAICPCKSMVTYALAVRSTSSMTTARTNLYWMIRYIRKWGIVALSFLGDSKNRGKAISHSSRIEEDKIYSSGNFREYIFEYMPDNH